MVFSKRKQDGNVYLTNNGVFVERVFAFRVTLNVYAVMLIER